MRSRFVIAAGACLIALLASLLFLDQPGKSVYGAVTASSPSFAANGDMLPPAKYREWIYVTSGIDMSYTPRADMANHSMFENVVVNPEAYRSFIATRT